MSDCVKCGKSCYAYVISATAGGERLCVDCFTQKKEDLANLIISLPDVVDLDPPLGYHFVGKSWFSVEFLGKSKADYLFKNWGNIA